jgi:hypothetical protein
VDVASIVSFFVFFLIIYAGYLNKLYNALFTFVLVTIASVVACNFFEPLGSLGFWPASWRAYAQGASFLLLFGITFFVLQILVTYLYPDTLGFSQLVNSLGGVFFVALAGIVLAGTLAIGYYLLPLYGEPKRKTFLKFDRQVASALTLINEKAGANKLNADERLLKVPKTKTKREPEERRPVWY